MIMYAIFGMLAVIVGITLANIQLKNDGVRGKSTVVIVSSKENKDKDKEENYEHWSFRKIAFTIVILVLYVAFVVFVIDYLHNNSGIVNIPVQN